MVKIKTSNDVSVTDFLFSSIPLPMAKWSLRKPALNSIGADFSFFSGYSPLPAFQFFHSPILSILNLCRPVTCPSNPSMKYKGAL